MLNLNQVPGTQLTTAFITLIKITVGHSKALIQANGNYIKTLQPGQVVDQFRSLVITGPRRMGHSSVIKQFLETNPLAMVLVPGRNALSYFNYPKGQSFYWQDFVASGLGQRGKQWEIIFVDNWRTGIRSINLNDVFQVTERFNPAPFYVFLG